MDQYFYLCLSWMYAIGLENKRGHKAQSPRVAFSIRSGRVNRWVLSEPAINDGENPNWNGLYILQFEKLYWKTATLSMTLYHKGKKYDTILGKVPRTPVSSLMPGRHELQVLDESEMHDGGRLGFEAEVVHPSTQQSFTLSVHSAQGLMNVKSFLKRISVRNLCMRKMRPYVVVESNLDNEQWVSPIAENAGKNPRLNFCHKCTCNESLIQKGEVNLTIKLHHRHKAESNRGPSDKDIMIGSVENIKVSPKEQGRIDHRVYTPKGEDGGKLSVSVTLGEPEQREHERWTPLPTRRSWQPRNRTPGLGHSRVGKFLRQFTMCAGPVSGTILAAVGIAGAAAA